MKKWPRSPMNEIFNLYRGSFPLAGAWPLLLVASSQTEANEVVATGIIFSRMPNGEDRITKRSAKVGGKFRQPLPDCDWTEVIASSASELVTSAWTKEFDTFKDPTWNEYMRFKGPLTWIKQDKPESGLLRYAIHANKTILDQLSSLAHQLPHPATAQALKQAIDVSLKVRLHEY